MSRPRRALIFLATQPLLAPSLLSLMIAWHAPFVRFSMTKDATALHDMAGRPIRLDGPAKRVVIYPPLLWEYLTVDPNIDHIAGVARYLREDARRTLLSRIYPGAGDLRRVLTMGRDTAIPGDPEDVLRLNADAVFTWSWFADSLNQAGLPTVEIHDSGNRYSYETDVKRSRLIAEVSGGMEIYRRELALNSELIAAVDNRVGIIKHLRITPPRVAYLDVDETGFFFAEGSSSFHAAALTQAGAINAVPLHGPNEVTVEQLFAWDPDVIVLGCFGSGSFPSKIYTDARLQPLKAVKERKVYKAPCGLSRMESLVEAPLLLSWMTEIFYPGQASKTFRSDLSRVYREIHGYRLSENEIDRLLFSSENRLSTNFMRFEREAPRRY